MARCSTDAGKKGSAAMTPTMPPPQIQRQLATRSHGRRILLILLLVFGSALGGAFWLLNTRGKTAAKATATPTTRPWMSQGVGYPDPEKGAEKTPVPPVDTITPELARLRNELLAMKLKLEELDKRKSAAPVINHAQPAQNQTRPPEKRPAPMQIGRAHV